MLTNQDSFLSELTKLIEAAKANGKSLYITMKKYDGRTTRNPRKPNDKPKRMNSKKQVNTRVDSTKTSDQKCLIRAKLGNKRMSCAVGQKDINKFQPLYSNVIKGYIDGLKKSTTSK